MNLTDYQAQLQAFWSANPGGWGAVWERIDGACPLTNPTNAMVLQWAGNKWGINPLLMYAEATSDGSFNTAALGDGGNSSGMCQVADSNGPGHENHAFPGFNGTSANLSRENACFNADFFAGHLYAAWRGWTGEDPGGDIGTAIQTWLVGHTSGPGSWTITLEDSMASQDWVGRFFNGQVVPF
jgi:hypothetical protein